MYNYYFVISDVSYPGAHQYTHLEVVECVWRDAAVPQLRDHLQAHPGARALLVVVVALDVVTVAHYQVEQTRHLSSERTYCIMTGQTNKFHRQNPLCSCIVLFTVLSYRTPDW